MAAPFDAGFDLTSDTPGFWEGFWERDNGRGEGGADPDMSSPTLKRYHKLLWSRELPNGETIVLEDDYPGYLRWGELRFGSDSIISSFRYERCRPVLESVAERVDYRPYVEDFLHRAYTIGGEIIFPRHRNSINQCRGNNRRISDRWDLTLECIRRFYAGEESPLGWCIEQDRTFFEKFVDFRGYVEFFCLQDCVNQDCTEVEIWLDGPLFEPDPLPRDADDYFEWMERSLDFVEKRNRRLTKLAESLGKRA